MSNESSQMCYPVSIRVLQESADLGEKRWVPPPAPIFVCYHVTSQELSAHAKWWIKQVRLKSNILLSIIFSGRRRAARWQRREGVCILRCNGLSRSLSFCVSCVFVCVRQWHGNGEWIERTLLWNVPQSTVESKRNLWIDTMLMSCRSIKWHRWRKS